jgi:hypothetical protein
LSVGGSILNDSGTSNDTTILSGGIVNVGGIVNRATVSGGGLPDVVRNGYAGGVTILSGGRLNVSGGALELKFLHQKLNAIHERDVADIRQMLTRTEERLGLETTSVSSSADHNA